MKKGKRILALLTTFILAVAMFIPLNAFASTNLVTVAQSYSKTSLTQGETFTVTLTLSNIDTVNGISSASLSYLIDPAKIEFVSATHMATAGGEPDWPIGYNTNTKKVNVGYIDQSGGLHPILVNGIYATLTFHVLDTATGTTTITESKGTFYNKNIDPDTQTGVPVTVTLTAPTTKTITINPASTPATGCTVDQATASVLVGASTSALTATVQPTTGTTDTITSWRSDSANATVTNAGVVTGVSAGTAHIYAKTSNNIESLNYCTVTVTNPLSTACDITSFSIGSYPVSTNGTAITVTVPYETDVTALTPTIGVSDNASVVGSGVSTSFASSKDYIVTAQSGATKTYTVTVVKSAKLIPTFGLTVDQATKEYTLTINNASAGSLYQVWVEEQDRKSVV